MTLARYLLGVLLGVVALAPVCAGAWALRRRLLPTWTGSLARLMEAVLGLGVALVVLEVLGAVRLYRLAPVVVALAGAGAVMWYLARRPVTDGPQREESAAIPRRAATRLGRGELVVALAASAALVAEWATRTVDAIHHGMVSVDTLWYHLPTAARFVQEGSVTQLHFVDPNPDVVFYPANTALFHGLGMLLFGNDVVSPLLNLGFLGLALLAGWCVGRPYGVAPVTLTGTALLLATPGFAATQPGGGYNDAAGLALLLASVAVLINGDPQRGAVRAPQLCIAALAAGFALGTKLTFIPVVAALSVGVIALSSAGQRARRGALWLGLVGLTGGFWYIRNFLRAANPLPGFSFGPLNLPSPPIGTPTSAVAHFLFDRQAWTGYFLPGLAKAYGPAWWALLVLVAGGLIVAVLTGPGSVSRMLGVVGILTVVAYLFSPQYLTVLGKPYYFVFNLRYASPALLLGLVLLPMSPIVAERRRSWLVLIAFALVLVAIQLDPSVWPTDLVGLRFADPVGGVDAWAGLAVGAAVLAVGGLLVAFGSRVTRWRPPVGALAAVGLVIVVAGFGLQRAYLRNRYTATLPVPTLYRWARHVHDQRIAVVGNLLFLQYPFYGRDLSNYVQYVGKTGPNGAFSRIRDCVEWRRVLNSGRYSYVAIAPTGSAFAGRPPELAWTAGDPAVTRVADEGSDIVLFRLSGHLDPRRCAALPKRLRTVSAP